MPASSVVGVDFRVEGTLLFSDEDGDADAEGGDEGRSVFGGVGVGIGICEGGKEGMGQGEGGGTGWGEDGGCYVGGGGRRHWSGEGCWGESRQVFLVTSSILYR